MLIIMRKVTVFAKLILCLVVLMSCAGSPPTASIEVMTYNLRYDNPGDGVNSWANRKEKVYALIKKYDPDIIGVQEALHHQLTDITENLPGYRYIGVGRDDGQQQGEYSAILLKHERFQIVETNTFWLSETPSVPGSKSWDAAITRIVTWAKLRDNETGKEFLFLNTHFDHIGEEARRHSAEIIKTRASEMAGDLPVVITGDFNFSRDDAGYETMMSPTGLVLVDPAPDNPPGTYCTFAVGSVPCRPIDYILHTKQLHAENYKVIDDHDGQNYPSDHLPVMVTLTWN